jgi:hypothetical protein
MYETSSVELLINKDIAYGFDGLLSRACHVQLALLGKLSRYESSFIILKLYLTHHEHRVSVFIALCTTTLFRKQRHCVTNSIHHCPIIALTERRGGTFHSNLRTELHLDVMIMASIEVQ